MKPTSRLITFPGVTHRTMPPWRKEIRERVREVQERRAHEAAAEAKAPMPTTAGIVNMPAPQLELLPHADAVDVNPLVVAALKRIERAHQPPPNEPRPSYPARLSATAGATDRVTSFTAISQDNDAVRTAAAATMFDSRRNDRRSGSKQSTATVNSAGVVAAVAASESLPSRDAEPAPVNLAVVMPVAIEADANQAEPKTPPAELSKTRAKPRRVISDDATDPALNYLDLVGVAFPQMADPVNRAPLFSRLMAGVVDILCVGLLSLPFAAVIELRSDSWRDPRTAILMAAAAATLMFVYLTVATALTGKTLGVKILSLRVIDTRTRLIPTGQQAAGRAIVFIFSLVTAGVGFLFALARGEGKTLHDRLSRTSVVRD